VDVNTKSNILRMTICLTRMTKIKKRTVFFQQHEYNLHTCYLTSSYLE
jgi:hypothetical protein